MTRLPEIQGCFQRFLLTGDPSIETHVIGTRRVPVATRLSIYGDGYRTRLIEALQASFPVLAEVLGEADFETLAAKYVQTHESTFFSVRYYGDALAEFLATDADYASAPVLAELARWEWALAAVFDAADADPIDASAFGQFAPEQWSQLIFDCSPSVQRLELAWNVPDIWKAATEGSPHPDPSLADEPGNWLAWRRELQIYFRPLAVAEATAMDAARSGQSFGELCERLCAYFEEHEAPARAAEYLRGWVQSGLIVSARLSSKES